MSLCKSGQIQNCCHPNALMTLKEYLMDDICTIFDECGRDENYIWGVYFVPAAEEEKVDAVYASLHLSVPSLMMIMKHGGGSVRSSDQTAEGAGGEPCTDRGFFQERLMARGGEMLAAAETISDSAEYFDVRRLAAFTKAKDTVFSSSAAG